MRIVITGSAGYIGRALSSRLITEGHDVIGLDSFEGINSRGDAIRCDITRDDLQALHGADAVVHLAARVSVTDSVKDPQSDAAVNLLGTIRVAQAAADAGVRRFVFASTCAVYGDSPRATVDSDLQPLCPYGIGKKAAEEYLRWFAGQGLPVTILRLGNVFGGDDQRGVWPLFQAARDAGRPAIIYGDGTATRSYVHISTVAEAFSLACRDDRPWIVRNVGGSVLTVNEIARAVGVDVVYSDHRPGEARVCVLV